MKDERKQAFYVQRALAKRRGIDFDLSFPEWWDVWDKSGKWNERGRGTGKYVMARKGPDIGGYTKGNVFIQLNSENARDGNLGNKHSAATRKKMSASRLKWKHTNTSKNKMSDSAKELPVKTCPHCGISSNGNTIYRWHFDNCKELTCA